MDNSKEIAFKVEAIQMMISDLKLMIIINEEDRSIHRAKTGMYLGMDSLNALRIVFEDLSMNSNSYTIDAELYRDFITKLTVITHRMKVIAHIIAVSDLSKTEEMEINVLLRPVAALLSEIGNLAPIIPTTPSTSNFYSLQLFKMIGMDKWLK